MHVSNAGFRALLLLALVCSSCKKTDRRREPPVPPPTESSNAAPRSPPTIAVHSPVDRLDLLEELPRCELRHRGLLLDLGSPAERFLRDEALQSAPRPLDSAAGDGEVAPISTQRTSFAFWLTSPVAQARLSFRIRGRSAQRMTVSLDKRKLGTLTLPRGDLDLVDTVFRGPLLSPGRHELALSFVGRTQTQEPTFADIDWIRIGPVSSGLRPYSAPTLASTLGDVGLGGVLKHALTLRPPSAVRCGLYVAKGSELRFSTGFWGDGRGRAIARVIAESGESHTLYDEEVRGGADARWLPVALPLDSFAGQIVEVELMARRAQASPSTDRRSRSTTRAEPGGRVVFGEPALARNSTSDLPLPRAHTAIIVVFAEINHSLLPPWSEVPGLDRLRDIAGEAVAFTRFRLSSSIAASNLATELSGTPPRAHGLERPDQRLSPEARTLQEMIKEASGRTAMFTSVPTSFAAFGLAEHWDRFESYSPVDDIAASEPFVRALSWLAAHPRSSSPRLVLIHARGGHPPWDLSRQASEALPPADYAGRLQPRRGALILKEIRDRQQRNLRRLSEADWIRLSAMQQTALADQDDALGKLVDALRADGTWPETLLVVTTDRALPDRPSLPFAPTAPLTEDRLQAPLLVKFPSAAAKGQRDVWVSDLDLTPTVLASLGLEVPAPLRGRDLWRSAVDGPPIDDRALLATLDNDFAVRWGRWLLRSSSGARPSLCQTDVDPACATDRFTSEPRIARELWYRTSDLFRLNPTGQPRANAEIDAPTRAALTVWGH